MKPKLPHRICPHCGYYKGKPVVIISEKEEKE
jgi:ribosomal protein L32